ncbi:Spy/CpxP family protein refolding chaperone [Desulfococcaceae bacterium HSG8]|nr:Spy/CpxP family protein refolding chaperone [Desulfococcaceae bacterium HSG8]
MEWKKVTESKKVRVITVIGVALMLVIGGAVVIGAHTDGFSCGAFRGHHGGKFHENFLAHIDERVEAFNLSESQTEGYKAIREKISSEMASHAEKRKQFISDISGELDQDSPNGEKIAEMLRQKANEVPEMASVHIGYILEFYNLLDDEQKQQVTEKIRERLAGCQGI